MPRGKPVGTKGTVDQSCGGHAPLESLKGLMEPVSPARLDSHNYGKDTPSTVERTSTAKAG